MKTTSPDAVPMSSAQMDVKVSSRSQGIQVAMDAKCAVRSRTILLVEDDADIRLVMTYFLQTLSFDVIDCPDAEIAARAFRRVPGIDLLMTDLQMPGRSGMELAFELTRLRPALPILIVSASILPAYTLNAIWQHGWAFLSKPCKLSSLAGVIDSLLNPTHPLAA